MINDNEKKNRVGIVGIGTAGIELINYLKSIDPKLGTYIAVNKEIVMNTGADIRIALPQPYCKLEETFKNFDFILTILSSGLEEDYEAYRQIASRINNLQITMDCLNVASVFSIILKKDFSQETLSKISKTCRIFYQFDGRQITNHLPRKVKVLEAQQEISKVIYLQFKNILPNISPFITQKGKVGYFWYIEHNDEWISSSIPVENAPSKASLSTHSISPQEFWNNSEYKKYGSFEDFPRGSVTFSESSNSLKVCCSGYIKKKAEKFLLDDGWFGWPLNYAEFIILPFYDPKK